VRTASSKDAVGYPGSDFYGIKVPFFMLGSLNVWKLAPQTQIVSAPSESAPIVAATIFSVARFVAEEGGPNDCAVRYE
jgi:hypothetical protein